MEIKNKITFWNNIYVVLVLRLLLVFALYTLVRFLFYLFNQSLFADIDAGYLLRLMWQGIKFDASAIAYTNLLVILMHVIPLEYRYNSTYQKAISIVYYTVNSIAITLSIGDMAYYRYTLRRTTAGFFKEFENESISNFVNLIWDYWYLSLLVLALVLFMIWANKKLEIHRLNFRKSKRVWVLSGVMMMSVFAFFTVGAMRGGYFTGCRPINLVAAGQFVRKPEHRAIVLNTPFSLIRTIGKNRLPRKDYFNEKELEEIFSVEQQTKKDRGTHYNKFAERNVMIILLEGFHREWVGVLNKDIKGYSGYTPFIDSLSTHSYIFARAYANGRKSVDAPPAVFSGIPSSEESFVLSHYSSNNINSLASILSEKGYTTAFYHGAINGSMGFDTFINQAGFDKYFGLDEYENKEDHDGHWGIWDERYLQYVAKELSKLREPFLASVLTLTSHNPFRVPEEYEGKFPKGHIPIHQCIGYTDYSLQQFFETASQQDWFDNTLFVITADHAVDGYLPEYKTAEGAFTVPILFYAPDSDLVGFDNSTVAQHTDIMPTILSMLGVEDRYIAFGNDMFYNDDLHFAFNYYNGAYQLIEDEWMLQFMDDETMGFYNIIEDRYMKNNLVDQLPLLQNKMEKLIKAIIQQYNNRLIDNDLVVE